ncbi:MAG: sugar ABC transporter permease [Lachnospiraceae bacterium]|nr:sugar ABC transporter permease [Lachnospiraceae bacterium]
MKHKENFFVRLQKDIVRNKWKYILILPVVVYFLVFHYKSMYGLVIAFQKFRPARGIAGSEWVGLYHFERLFSDVYFPRSLRNTLLISVLTLIFSFPIPIIFALILNECRVSWFKRIIQTVTYMPHFISLVVICGLVSTFCSSEGLVNQILEFVGIESKESLLTKPELFYAIYILSGIWQNFGWDSIIYLATLSGIDVEQYEAAKIDGAGRLQQMRYITLPGLIPTASMLLVLKIGGLLSVGYEKILLLYNDLTLEVADVLSTYNYRKGLVDGEYSYSTALGLFNSVVNIILIVMANKLSKKAGQSGIF